MIQLGDGVQCKVTGFIGVVTGITYWLNGCVRVGVQGQSTKDGVPTEVQWIDDVQLKVVTPGKLAIKQPSLGGERPPVKRAVDAGR